MNFEYEAFGFYLSNHVVTEYRGKYNNHLTIKELKNYFDKNVDLIAYVDSIKEIVTKNNQKMVFIGVSDETAKNDMVMFPNVYSSINSIEKGDILYINVHVEKRFDKYQLIVNKVLEQIKD